LRLIQEAASLPPLVSLFGACPRSLVIEELSALLCALAAAGLRGFLIQLFLEAACDAGAGVTAYLNQHWIPGSPRRPALAHVLAGSAGSESLKAGAGHPLIRGVQGLALHGEVDFLRFDFTAAIMG
jgi:hypothetical protein